MIEPVKVVYVLGRGRGGSTILANVLGALPGYVSGGEIRYLIDPVLTSGLQCACGRSPRDCVMWKDAVTALDGVDVAAAARWQREVVRERNFVRLLRARPGEPSGWPALDSYVEVLGLVYAALARSTGAAVIVDSSKRPSYGAVLRLVGAVTPCFVHLVRDPRASAHSWKQRRHAAPGGGEVARRNSLDSTLRWVILNLEAEALLRRSTAGLRLRYEDFVARPRPAVERVVELAGEPVPELPFESEHAVRMQPAHTLAGNPSRFAAGVVELRDMQEWRGGQSVFDRWVATAVAAPLMVRYGYVRRPGRSRAARAPVP